MAGGQEVDGFALDTEIGLFAMKTRAGGQGDDASTSRDIEIDFIQLAPIAIYNYICVRRGQGAAGGEGYNSEARRLDGRAVDRHRHDRPGGDQWLPRCRQRNIPLGGNHLPGARMARPPRKPRPSWRESLTRPSRSWSPKSGRPCGRTRAIPGRRPRGGGDFPGAALGEARRGRRACARLGSAERSGSLPGGAAGLRSRPARARIGAHRLAADGGHHLPQAWSGRPGGAAGAASAVPWAVFSNYLARERGDQGSLAALLAGAGHPEAELF